MRTRFRTRSFTIATVALIVSSASTPAVASTASEERQGAALVKAVNTQARSCKSLAPADLERIGEYAMGLSFTTTAGHDVMNRRMRAMMGARGSDQAHQAMGRNFGGCGSTGQNGSSGIGMMGGYGSSGSGMMGGSAYGPGMMGGNGGADGQALRTSDDGQGLSTPAALLLAVLAAVLGAVLFALVAPRLKGRGPTVHTS